MNKLEIASFLKSRRKQLNLTIKEVINLLHNNGIDISEKTLYGWESGARQPDADTFVVLCMVYQVNSLSEVTMIPGADHINEIEYQHIKKYRQLPETGKQAVESMMDTMLAAQPKQAEEGPIIREVYRMAKSVDDRAPTIEKRDITKFRNAPKVTREEDI